ncbi:putative membrane protein [Bacteroides fragilis str. J-143-4]|nr:putative membrane protein [Bacteroides fragilis str. 3774 T13]EXY43723.1 putative membrane protein [Bacteroides fragilis str. 3783N1-2]EXY50756.1 putative membrane protein [Bacteroides fragilis str. 3783N2-1]EXY55591.1 putative membrane protein [Bacteroides fragilis str. 3976T7]EXZ18942.1 putative membrane protein [Bacteroides fragilis str. J-143-4]OCR32336.1 hypothetical protein AC140_25140 [Bacteroides fragilis]
MICFFFILFFVLWFISFLLNAGRTIGDIRWLSLFRYFLNI